MDTRSEVRRPVLVACAVVATLAVVAWATAAVLMAGRGFDITDEGFYLLSFRYWDESLRATTGTQYLYGPVFGLLGGDIAGLRVFRLLTILGSSAVFAWAFMQWLRTQQPRVHPSGLWEYAGVAAISAGSGLMYAWLPLSPGYNDVTALGALLGGAAVFRIAWHVDTSGRAPARLPALLGLLGFAVVLGKWTAGPMMVLLGLVCLVLVGRTGWVRFVAWCAFGVVAAAGIFQFAVIPLQDAIPPIVDVNRLAGGADHPPSEILSNYARTGWSLASYTVVRHFPLLAVALVLPFVRQRLVALGLGGPAFAWSVAVIAVDGGWQGGSANSTAFSSALLAMTLAVLLVGLTSSASRGTRPPPRQALLAGLLVVLPYLHALGTNNALWLMAETCFAAWMALVVWVVTSVERARWLALVCGAAAVVLAAAVAVDATLVHPYRADAYADATTVVAGGETPLGDQRVSPRTAREYAALREALQPFLTPAPASVLAWDKMPGLILMLGARPVGEAWTGPTARPRSAAGLEEECRSGLLESPPILFYNRRPGRLDRDALASCGWSLKADYRRLPVPGGPPHMRVLVPLLEG